jgi:hypothetical protein
LSRQAGKTSYKGVLAVLQWVKTSSASHWQQREKPLQSKASKAPTKHSASTPKNPAVKGQQGRDSKAGLAVVFTFLSIALFLYLTPGFLENVIVTRAISAILAAIGVMGLGTELNQMSGKKKFSGIDDLGIGLVLTLLWIVAYHFSPGWWWINTILLLLLFIPIFGTALGVIRLLSSLLVAPPAATNQNTTTTIGNIIVKLFLATAQIAAFVLTVIQLSQIFKIVPK